MDYKQNDDVYDFILEDDKLKMNWQNQAILFGWLLLPIIQLGELVKRDCGENKQAIEENTLGYFGIATIIVLIWFISIPLWIPFLRDALQLDNYKTIFDITILSVGFYVLFAYNNVVDSIFYGIGKTQYMLFQSIVINTLFYGGLFIFYITKHYEPTLMKTALMFAGGIAFDSLLTYGMFAWMLEKDKLKLI